MMVQMEDYATCLKVLYPDCQFVDEYDWSGVHGFKKEDGLDVSNMNVKFGGAVAAKHNTKITDAGCLGPHSATITINDVEHDCKLKVNDVQSMIFLETDPPPFYDLECPKHGTVTGEKRKKPKKKRKKTKESSVQRQMAQAPAEGGGGHNPFWLRRETERPSRCGLRTRLA